MTVVSCIFYKWGTMRDAWEERSRRFGLDLRSVLFRSYPESVNRVIHAWHADEICRLIRLCHIPQDASGLFLDLGCGYGRLSAELALRMPKLRAVGIDFSENFARLYTDFAGMPAVVGSIESLPFRGEVFDFAISVTSLMYLPKEGLQTAVFEALRVVRHGGCVLLIEPASHYVWKPAEALISRFAGGGSSEGEHETRGRRIPASEIVGAIKSCGGRLILSGGPLLLSLFMPLLFALSFASAGASFRLGSILTRANLVPGWLGSLSLYRVYLARKE